MKLTLIFFSYVFHGISEAGICKGEWGNLDKAICGYSRLLTPSHDRVSTRGRDLDYVCYILSHV